METVALLMAPIGGLVVGLVVYFVATRQADRDLRRAAKEPAPERRG